MSKLKIYLGQSGSGKTTALFKDCLEKAEKDLKKNCIVIVPDQVSHAVTGKLIEMSERHGIMNIDVLSFQRLAHRIFDNAGNDDKELIDDTDKNLILKTVIDEHVGELTVLKKNIGLNGYVSEMKSIISEFVQYEISPEDVEKLSEQQIRKGAYFSHKLKDIHVIYKAFREKIEERYVTKEELLDRASEAAERAEFLKGADIYLDDFTGFTPIQYRFLAVLFGLVENVSLCLDYDGKDGELFNLSVLTISRMREIAEGAGYETETLHFYDNKDNRFIKSPGLNKLERNLFREERKKEEPYLTEDVRIVRCDTPEKESAFIISEIIRAVREEGLRYREIGIVMSDPASQGRILKQEAELNKVPLFIDTTEELLLNPYTEFIKSALEVVSTAFSYEAVFHFLRTFLHDIPRDDIDLLENYVRAFGIRGKKRYSEEFRLHMKRLDEEGLSRINAARAGLVDILLPLTEMGKGGKKTAREYTEGLMEFLKKTGAVKRMEDLAEGFKKDNKQREAMVYGNVTDKVDKLLNKILNLIPDEKMDLKEYSGILSAGFEAIRIGVLPTGMDVVRAGDMTRSRLDDIRILFFMGMNDTLIPEDNSGSGILSDLDREALSEKGVTLAPTARERAGLNKLYFYMNVTKPSERLYLTYSRGSTDGKTMRPSYYLKEIERIFPDNKEIPSSGVDMEERIYTGNYALKILTKWLKNNEKKDELKELIACLSKDPDMERVIIRILESTLLPHGEDRLSAAVRAALYGDTKLLSPTRLERFAECAYRHYMSYGLRAMEREEFGFERKDLGSVLHEVLNICGEILSDEGKSFSDLKGNEAERLSEAALKKFLDENENTVLLSSERNKYFVKRIGRILKTTVETLKTQCEKGTFDPDGFERHFELNGMWGRIDRIDTAEENSALYVSVIDYKSGNKSFDLSRIYYGLDLQLVIYLNGAMEIERIAHPGKEVLPAGIFYYHIDDPLIKAADLKEGTDQEIEEKRRDMLKLRGIVNSDPGVIKLFDSHMTDRSSVIPVSYNKDGSFSAYSSVADSEELKVISSHVMKKAMEFKDRMTDGEIDPSPAVYGEKSVCSYCEFGDCCGFEKGKPGFKERRLKKIKDKEEVLEKMAGKP